MARFLPPFCTQYVPVSLEIKEEPEGPVKKELTRRLEPALWQLAWDRFALAQAMTEQMPFAKTLLHKQVCMEISVTASAEERFPLLGVLYDEVCR